MQAVVEGAAYVGAVAENEVSRVKDDRPASDSDTETAEEADGGPVVGSDVEEEAREASDVEEKLDSDSALLEELLREQESEPTTEKWQQRHPRSASSKVQSFIQRNHAVSDDAGSSDDEWMPSGDNSHGAAPKRGGRPPGNDPDAAAPKRRGPRPRRLSHENSLVAACPRCRAILLRTDLQNHERECGHDGSSGGAAYICEYCAKTFSVRSHLSTHIRNQHRKRACVCEQCGVVSASTMALYAHKMSWHGERRIACSACDRRFLSPFALRKHARRHDAHRPRTFSCSYAGCRRAFYEAKHLEVHMLRHTDEKPLQCRHCDFVCRQRNSINYHVSKYHPDKAPHK
ncbi:PREDICTED: zinc finger protein 45-like [Priapulus caudatus]|uniref:Zinc finger protein 45-like n=1 Tax=Priapulus caudatus TaxID=37621 RepID=A0ABM1EJT6_PRICU|nr:PREDICTED: zinc finger protein 45-like [Priapulus caudatus]